MPTVEGTDSLRLIDLARVVRSKNAGPLHLTFDLMFADRASYERCVQSPGLNAGRIAPLYGVAPDDVRIQPYPVALAVKITLPRLMPAGSPGDHDVYGAQQHVPLLELEL